MPTPRDPERRRLAAAAQGVPWRRWGPYLAEREWGTVREDYSPDGAAWDFFPHAHARSRAYRWGEDGLLGFSDDRGLLCLAITLWNGADDILKERLYGLTGSQGNHHEDVKEYYFFLDGTPTHSFMKALFKYPQRPFPYAALLEENRRRGRDDPEYELLDTGIFRDDRYFDVTVEYAKVTPDDLLIRLTAVNRGPEAASLHVLPTLWFRNTWAWGRDSRRPELCAEGRRLVRATHPDLGEYWLASSGRPALLFTENESNAETLWKAPNRTPYVKDGIGEAVIHGARHAVNSERRGTKAAAHYRFRLAPGASRSVHLRLSASRHIRPFAGADELFRRRQAEADCFYASLAEGLDDDQRLVQRQAFAGLLWSKQFYHFDVDEWLDGDPAGPPPPDARKTGRNADWRGLRNADVILMPDTWEYPWYASWDLAFHCLPAAPLDPEFAKQQLLLLLGHGYMKPDGQMPSYEWAFGHVTPPVHAWAAWWVYQHERQRGGRGDRAFLERIFGKLLSNFTWWLTSMDRDGEYIFEGGFLGLDNVGVIDRGAPLPAGGHLDEADGTAWMGLYSLSMLAMAVELAREDPHYQEQALQFLAYFLRIAGALNDSVEGSGLWDEVDGFFYDVLRLANDVRQPMKVRSLVGLLPLAAVTVLEADALAAVPGFQERVARFFQDQPRVAPLLAGWLQPGVEERRLLAAVDPERLRGLLRRMLDPAEFWSAHGVRSLSRYHLDHPYALELEGRPHSIGYEPAESRSGPFGENSNWRGPVWFPINFLLVEALRQYHRYYGEGFRVECPTGSGRLCTLGEVADELARRLCSIFLRGPDGSRPVYNCSPLWKSDPHWRYVLLFYEYFHGDSGVGLGASHQTGWTALVALLLAGKPGAG